MIKLLSLLLESIENIIWYHGTNKSWEDPKLTVGEFSNTGGFFISPDINFAKRWGKIIKSYKLKPNTKIFDVRNPNHRKIWASHIAQNYNIPNLSLEDYEMLTYPVDAPKNYFGIILNKAYPQDFKTYSKEYMEGTPVGYDEEGEPLEYYESKEQYAVDQMLKEPSTKYDTFKYILRNKQLYPDYHSIEIKDADLRKIGFDGAFIKETGIWNIQLYNIDKLMNG